MSPSSLRSILVVVPALVGPLSAVGSEPRYPSRSDIPEWWRNTRAFYCPWENSGAGASLMKFKAHRDEGFESFNDLDKVLDDARRLGTNVLYLVGYWEPDYEHKAEYRPKLKWGGDTAFRQGIEKVHRLDGRVIVYLEAFIISRNTDLGRTKGPQWAMMDETGRYYPYDGTGDRFYLMYPGPGSGWTDYLVEVAARLARDFRIDGVHLDSYGLQWGWKNHNPAHPEGRDPESFNRGAVELVRRVRDEMRKHVPDAVVILEGAEHTALLDVCDGAQIESLAVIHRKPWAAQGRYPVFTSSFSIEEMGRILDEGHNLAISPWWLMARPARRDEKTLLAQTDKRSRFDQIEALHRYHNILLVNGRLPQPVADFDGLSQGILEHLNRNGWTSRFSHPPLVEAAQRYIAAYNRDEGRLTRVPADLIRQMLLAASSRPAAASRPG
ncbi:MAG TPA: DUF6259 domain-containing protein [Phycisphaerae bacterium]|nr:DUF6259 domain-containing protein [Phycisphaerae bacterium]HRR86448.1 DUF6259 domain-containing protein [Phycisphaerae bacterium]